MALIVSRLPGSSNTVDPVVNSLYGPSSTYYPVVNSPPDPPAPLLLLLAAFIALSYAVAPVVNSSLAPRMLLPLLLTASMTPPILLLLLLPAYLAPPALFLMLLTCPCPQYCCSCFQQPPLPQPHCFFCC